MGRCRDRARRVNDGLVGAELLKEPLELGAALLDFDADLERSLSVQRDIHQAIFEGHRQARGWRSPGESDVLVHLDVVLPVRIRPLGLRVAREPGVRAFCPGPGRAA